MAYLGIFANFLEYLKLVTIGNIPLRLRVLSILIFFSLLNHK